MLSDILKLLNENKEWIFSGIGVLIISGIFFLFKNLLSLKKLAPHKVDSKSSYLHKIYEFYQKSESSNIIYTCTSSWPIAQDNREILKNLKASSIVFLGPIKNGKKFLGVLWRIGISFESEREQDFIFYHREKPGVKFVIAGNNVVISDSMDESPSETGTSWNDFTELASLLRRFFDDLKKSATILEDHICDLIIEGFKTNPKKIVKLKDLLLDLTSGESDMDFTVDQQLDILKRYLSKILPKRGLKLFEDSNITYIVYNPKTIISERRKFIDELPAVRLILTPDCNFKCSYCPKFNEDFQEVGPTLTAQELITFINICKQIGFKSYRFSGGEPLLTPQKFFKCIEACKLDSHDYQIYLTTNGSLLQEHLSRLGDFSNLVVKISLDTLDKHKFEFITNTNSNTFVKIINSIKSIPENITVGINTVVTKDNKDDIKSLVDFCSKNGCYLKLMDLNWYSDQVPHNYWQKKYHPTTDYIRDFSELYKNEKVTTKGGYGIPMQQFEISNKTWIRIKDSSVGSTYAPYCLDKCEVFHSCQEGIYQLTLTSDGKLKICRHKPAETSIDISGYLRENNEEQIRTSILHQLKNYFFSSSFYIR